MSGFLNDLYDMRVGLASRVRRWRTMAARTTPGPLLVRGAVWAAGATAMVLAYPIPLLLDRYGLALLALTALPALAPRSLVVTPVTLVAVIGWVASTTGSGAPPSLAHLLGLATCLYLMHTGAALAAQVPYDAIVDPAVLMRWFARVGLVLGVTAALAIYLLVLADLLGGAGTLLATLAGFGVAVGLALFLARLLRRPG
ncbi:MAG TPA: hypothetical protein VFM54_10785 [Micromonosporaceae bacterium]|nr:hypothetical protein [Micromonosporaceae bacterium]